MTHCRHTYRCGTVIASGHPQCCLCIRSQGLTWAGHPGAKWSLVLRFMSLQQRVPSESAAGQAVQRACTCLAVSLRKMTCREA